MGTKSSRTLRALLLAPLLCLVLAGKKKNDPSGLAGVVPEDGYR